MTLTERCKEIKLVLFDVDGVLTNGDIYIDGTGEQYKQFNVKDGVSVALLKTHNVMSGVISGKHSEALSTRCSQLKLDIVVTGCHNKIKALQEILTKHNLTLSQVVFVGDDVIDLTVLESVGIGFAPADAHLLVRRRVEFITESLGGQGVAREVAEFVLTNRGLTLEEVYQPLMEQWNETEVTQ